MMAIALQRMIRFAPKISITPANPTVALVDQHRRRPHDDLSTVGSGIPQPRRWFVTDQHLGRPLGDRIGRANTCSAITNQGCWHFADQHRRRARANNRSANVRDRRGTRRLHRTSMHICQSGRGRHDGFSHIRVDVNTCSLKRTKLPVGSKYDLSGSSTDTDQAACDLDHARSIDGDKLSFIGHFQGITATDADNLAVDRHTQVVDRDRRFADR